MSYALVTGASKGIGKAIAEELAKQKFNLILVARSESLLHDTANHLKLTYNIDVVYVVKDLSNPAAPEELAKWVIDKNLPLTALVNNAGYGLWGRFEELSLKDQLDMMRIDVDCVVKLTHLLLPLLKKQKQAYILNIASTAAYQAVPTLSVYAACKSFVVLFSRGLKYEFKDTNISVTCISPGATATNFMNRAGMHSEKMLKNADKFNMQPTEVAKCAVSKMLKKKNEVIPGFVNRISVKMTYFVPKGLTEKIAAGLYKN
jgi:hypothetical protein